jgi:hypothetical protein
MAEVLMEVWPPLELVDAQNLRFEAEVAREGRHVKGGGAQVSLQFLFPSDQYF